MRWLQDPNQRNIYNLKSARREASRYFREKRHNVIQKGKIDELKINGKDINIRVMYRGFNDFKKDNQIRI